LSAAVTVTRFGREEHVLRLEDDAPEPIRQEPLVLGHEFVEEILGRPVSQEEIRAWRYQLAPFEANLLMAYLKAQRLGVENIRLGAPTLSLEQLHEEMGDDLFFWPPFWHRLLGMTRLARHPNYLSSPRKYRAHLEGMKNENTGRPVFDRSTIDLLVRLNTPETARSGSDKAFGELKKFFGLLVSRRSVKRRSDEELTFLRDDYLRVPRGKRAEWVKTIAARRSVSEATIRRQVRPSFKRKTKR
jgi:hypothetical protein